jgi:hypothetical protein
MPREGQPATPPGGNVQRAAGPPATGGLEEPPRRPGPPVDSRPPVRAAPRLRTARAPAPAPEPALASTGPDATGREYHPHESFRPSTWWKALKNSWALTRWIVLVLAVGIGTAAVVAVLMAALFTIVDSSL